MYSFINKDALMIQRLNESFQCFQVFGLNFNNYQKIGMNLLNFFSCCIAKVLRKLIFCQN